MTRGNQAFVSNPLPMRGLSAGASTHVSSFAARHTHCIRAVPARRSQICMQEKTKKKKESAVTFSVDIKGNFVWTLRSASPEDVSSISNIVGPNLPESIISVLVEDSPCCTVCETSVKGGKAGDEFVPRVLGAALVDVSLEASDAGMVKRADFITVCSDPKLPEAGEVQTKMILGCLKKLKESGCVEVTSDVSAERTDRIALLKSCLFKEKENADGRVKLVCNLGFENPDPQKKLL